MLELFSQKRGVYRTRFSFDETGLDFSLRDSMVKQGGRIDYDAIPADWAYEEKKIWWPKYLAGLGVIFPLIAAILIGFRDTPNLPHGLHEGGIIFIFTLAGYAFLYAMLLFFYRQTPFTVILSNPEIRIIRDEQHDRIADEIRKRRQEALRKKYMAVDVLNSLSDELSKFKNLWEEGTISDAEYQAARTQIAAARHEFLREDERTEADQLH